MEKVTFTKSYYEFEKEMEKRFTNNPFLQRTRNDEFNKLEELYKVLLNLQNDGPYHTIFNDTMYKHLHQKRHEMMDLLVELGNELNNK